MRLSKRFMKSVMLYSLLFLFLSFILNSSIATAGVTGSRSDNPYHIIPRKTDMFRILSVLENRIDMQNLPEEEKIKLLGMAKNKLFTLDDSQIQLLASLSNRITNNSHTTAGDVAFLLITALIVLS